jgi:hypothetical protein
MNDDTSAPGNDGGAARKRPPPTIELTAQAVSETAREAETESRAQEQAEQQARTQEQTEQAQEAAAAPPPDAESSTATDAASAPPRAARGSAFPVLLSAIAGAAASVAVLGAATFAGWPARNAPTPPPGVSKTDIDALGARVAGIEAAAARPAPAPRTVADPAVVARLDALDKSIAALRTDVAAARSQSDKAVAALDEIKSAAPPQAVAAAPAIDGAAIDARLGKLEQATSALSAAVAKPAPPPPPPVEDPRLRRAVAATLLDSVVRQGEPFAAALAAARAASDNTGALAPLESFATTGVPSAAALSRELVALLPQLAPKEERAPASSGLVERLQHSAARLVRVQRTDTPSGASAGDGAVLARIAAAAKRDDINGARREMDQLSAAQRAVLQPWIAKADARAAALAAARQFAADTMTALAKPAR